MSVKANVLAIAALKSRKREYEVAVREHRGLVVTVYPSGTKTFALRYRQDGALRRIQLDKPSFEEASDEWRRQRAQLKLGEDPSAQVKTKRAAKQLERKEARAAPSVHQLATDFIELYAKRKKRSWRNDQRMLESEVLPVWGSIKAATITRRDVVALLDRIAATRPVYANRVFAVTRKMFNWAFDRDLIEATPCARVKPPGKETSRERVLTDDELRTFWMKLPESGAPPSLQTALRLQLLTASRIGEILGARWDEIDLKRRELLVPGKRSKNGLENVVPLSPLAVDLIKSLERTSAFVFPAGGKAGHVRIDVATHELARAVPRLGLAHFTSHDLRRTAATKLAELRTPRVVIDLILNHKDKSVGGIYDRHTYTSEKRAALEALSNHLLTLMHSEQVTTVVPMRSRRGR